MLSVYIFSRPESIVSATSDVIFLILIVVTSIDMSSSADIITMSAAVKDISVPNMENTLFEGMIAANVQSVPSIFENAAIYSWLPILKRLKAPCVCRLKT